MNFYNRLKLIMINLSQEANTKENQYGKEILKNTYNYLKSGDYSSIKNKEIILQNLELSSKELSKNTGISEQALSKARYRIFKDLERKLSKQYLLFLEDKQWVKAADLLFLAQSKNLSNNYLLSEFTNELRQLSTNRTGFSKKHYSLKECAKELKLMRVYSYPMMSDLISELDNQSFEKIIYLILLLDGLIDSPLDRHQLFRLLTKGNN